MTRMIDRWHELYHKDVPSLKCPYCADEMMENDMATTETRPLHEIARDVREHWTNVNYAAEPYLEAMDALDKVTDSFFLDSGDSVVRYFLSNATGWRGEDARRIKAELKAML